MATVSKMKQDWATKFLISQGHEIVEQADIDACTTPLRVTLKYLRAERAVTKRKIKAMRNEVWRSAPSKALLDELLRRLYGSSKRN